jgi:hypothetical protein
LMAGEPAVAPEQGRTDPVTDLVLRQLQHVLDVDKLGHGTVVEVLGIRLQALQVVEQRRTNELLETLVEYAEHEYRRVRCY